jgi:hypothetical protein
MGKGTYEETLVSDSAHSVERSRHGENGRFRLLVGVDGSSNERAYGGDAVRNLRRLSRTVQGGGLRVLSDPSVPL